MAFQKQLKFDNGTIAQTFPAIISLAPNSAIKHHSLMDLPATHFSVHSNLRLPSRISDPKQPISPIGPPPCFHFGPPRPIFLPLFVLFLALRTAEEGLPPDGRNHRRSGANRSLGTQHGGNAHRRRPPQADRSGSLGWTGEEASDSSVVSSRHHVFCRLFQISAS